MFSEMLLHVTLRCFGACYSPAAVVDCITPCSHRVNSRVNCYLHEEDGRLLLRVVLAGHLFQGVQQVPPSQPLHEDNHLLLVLDHLVAPHNVGVIQQLQEVSLPASCPQGISAGARRIYSWEMSR